MKMTKTILQNNGLRLWKKAPLTISLTALLALMILGNSISASAQFTFVGDYDKTFAAPNGYYTDPRDIDPTVEEYQTFFYTGGLLPDGSIIAGGRLVTSEVSGDFYVKKLTAPGALDASFGTNGFIRTNFYAGGGTSKTNDVPYVLKVQQDGKIVFAGECLGLDPANNNQTPAFGSDACIVRYNANGTLDTTFGGFPLAVTGQGETVHSISIDPGKVIVQTGLVASGQKYGTGGKFYDMTIQPDGKIVLVGETRNANSFFSGSTYSAIIVRLNANGSLDTTFGAGGFARWTAAEAAPSCFPRQSFHGVQVQPDGRILAVGQNEVVDTADCGNRRGSRFVATRWTAGGQLETVRHLDSNANFNNQREGAGSILLTRDGNKVIVSGTYRNLDGTSSHRPTMVRFNLSDLSVDPTFGSGGIGQYNGCPNAECGFFSGGRLQVKAIQPDGRIIGVDGMGSSGNVVRFNPDGSADQSFGNWEIGNNTGGRGRLRVLVTFYNGASPVLEAGHILVRPNGRINLLGHGANIEPNFFTRAAVSQHNTYFQNGIYADFENDGKDNLAVYRPSEGIWHNLDSRNNSYSAAQWGISSDKLAPADYDGDGRTDRAVFRDGTWYISRSSNGQALVLNFGISGDLPRPGDFDGDGLADISVFRPSNGVWYRLNSSNGSFSAIQFGQNGDVPMLGDYDADGRTDFAVFRPSNSVWYIFRSSDNQVQVDAFGTSGDIPLNGDFNGDSRSDLAVFRPSNRTWYIARGTGAPGQNYDSIEFGLSTDVPVAADYDNDGKTDVAVYRNGSWWILRSGTNDVINSQFGLSTDKPIAAAYLP